MDTKIKVKVDVMAVLKQVRKNCINNECYKCEFAYISKYDDVKCALCNTPMYWELKKVGDK